MPGPAGLAVPVQGQPQALLFQRFAVAHILSVQGRPAAIAAQHKNLPLGFDADQIGGARTAVGRAVGVIVHILRHQHLVPVRGQHMHRGVVAVHIHRLLIPGAAVLKHAGHGGLIDAGGAFQIKRAPNHGVVLIDLHSVAVKLIPVGGVAFLDPAAGGIQHGVPLALAAQQHLPVVQNAVHRLLAHLFAVRAVQIGLRVRAFHAHRIALGPTVLLHFLLVILHLFNVVVIRVRQVGQHVQFRVHLLGPVAVEQVILPVPHHIISHSQAAGAAGIQIIEAVVGHIGAGLHPLAAQQKKLPPRHRGGDGPLLLQQLGPVCIVHGIVIVCIALIVPCIRHHKQVGGVRLPVPQHIHVPALGAEHLLPGPQHPPHRGGLLLPGEAAAVCQILAADNDQAVRVIRRLPGSICGALGRLGRTL